MGFTKIYQSLKATERVYLREDIRQRKEMEAVLLNQAKNWTHEQKQAYINDLLYSEDKSLLLAYVFWLLFSHYAYLGKWGKWFIFIITGGGFMIWWIVDFFRLPKIIDQLTDKQYKKYLAIMIENA